MGQKIMEQSNRVQKWDVIKGILMIAVVLGHLADFYTADSEKMRSLFLFIYTFHMPLFVFMSGMFSKKMIDSGRNDKIAGYFALYIWVKIILWIYKIIVYGDFSFNFFTESGLPWFIFALFVFPIITRLVRNFSPKHVLFVSLLLSCVIGYDSNVSDFLVLSRIIVFFPFYYVGYLLDYKKIGAYRPAPGVKAGCLAFLAVVAVAIAVLGDKIYWIRPMLTGGNPYVALGDYEPYGFLIRFGFYVLAALMIAAIIMVAPVKWNGKLLLRIGQNTLPIYVFHYTVLFILFNQLHIKAVFDRIIPGHGGILIIPLAIVIAFVLALPPFAKVTNMMYTAPLRKKTADQGQKPE